MVGPDAYSIPLLDELAVAPGAIMESTCLIVTGLLIPNGDAPPQTQGSGSAAALGYGG